MGYYTLLPNFITSCLQTDLRPTESSPSSFARGRDKTCPVVSTSALQFQQAKTVFRYLSHFFLSWKDVSSPHIGVLQFERVETVVRYPVIPSTMSSVPGKLCGKIVRCMHLCVEEAGSDHICSCRREWRFDLGCGHWVSGKVISSNHS